MKTGLAIEQFIRHKQQIGCVFTTDARSLRRFCRSVGPETPLRRIRPELVAEYLNQNEAVTETYWQREYYALKGFYGFALQQAFVSRSPLPVVRKCHQNFKPYIFSRPEIRRLIDGTATYQKCLHLLEPYTLRTFLLLLYGTGIRISEAANLTQADVNLKQRVLSIRRTKFYKTRLVGIGRDLRKVLNKYRKERAAAGHSITEDAPFFTCKNGHPMKACIIRGAFVRLRKQVGINRSDAKQQPRLHDLRHTFAVHRLISWY